MELVISSISKCRIAGTHSYKNKYYDDQYKTKTHESWTL